MNAAKRVYSSRRFRTLALLSILLGTAAALLAAELLLRHHNNRIATSEHMQPGLIGFDSRLGWKLMPGWSGNHRHYDFDVEYRVNASGLRHDARQARREGPQVAVLGDSFTFGLGVEDHQTFVSLLNAGAAKTGKFINLGVPGYSTDQQLIQLRSLIQSDPPDAIVLVVYLANDLFDNSLPFPLQAEHAKPYFILDEAGKLQARNTPVPLASKPAAARETTLTRIILGEGMSKPTLLQRTLGKTQLARRLGVFQTGQDLPEEVLHQTLAPYIRLFGALLDEFDKTAQQLDAPLFLVLLPGSSWVKQPDGLSARYQEYLRGQLVALAGHSPRIKLVDLAAALRATERSASFYFPNEGHLNAEGHRYVADVIGKQLGKQLQ